LQAWVLVGRAEEEVALPVGVLPVDVAPPPPTSRVSVGWVEVGEDDEAVEEPGIEEFAVAIVANELARDKIVESD